MGIAVANADSDASPKALIHRADIGLYKAKRNGRDRVEQVDPDELGDGPSSAATSHGLASPASQK
jgi:predicted signal transduction protein with EAL and GGDEF domain